MALALAFNIDLSSDGAILTIIDKTGAYSGLNVGGFGTPNPEISDALTATVKIAKRNADGTFGTDTTIDAYSTLPSNSAGEFDITATDGVTAATYPDGIYRFIYTVTGVSGGTAFSTSTTRYETLRNSIAVCYQEKAATLADCSCSCNDIEDSFKCFSLYMRLLKSAECCGNLNDIQKYLDKLTSMCDSNSCC